MHAMARRLAYYITPHGFGHAVRSLEVISALTQLDPGLEVVIISDIPSFLIRQNVSARPAYRRKRLDVGLVQEDSLRFDLEATRERLQELRSNQDALITEEDRFLAEEQITAVVSDVAFLPFVAAVRRGIPNIGLGNFTWDWIYQAYAPYDSRWQPLVEWIREAYLHCELFLQLPMHGDCSACPRILPVPLVARRARRERGVVRRILGLADHHRAYLVSFTALPLESAAQKRLESIAHSVFLYKEPLKYAFANSLCLDDMDISYAEAVAAVEGVITKPGYGIVSDCLSHGTPMVYSDRGLFPEYPILVEAMTRHLNTVYLPSPELYAGRWQAAIRQLEAQPRRQPGIAINGAEVCAQAILSHLGDAPRSSDPACSIGLQPVPSDASSQLAVTTKFFSNR
jgi:hypothetical protein